MTNEKNHPFKHDIIGKSKEYLLNRKLYVLNAISMWGKNAYNDTQDVVKYNINYFETELQIINKELLKFNAA